MVTSHEGGKTSQPSGTPTHSQIRNDITDSAAYDHARELDTSIEKMKMVFDKSIDMSILTEERLGSEYTKPGDMSRILKPI